MTYHLNLKAYHLPGDGRMEFQRSEDAIEMALGFALPDMPCRIYRDPEFTDLFAVVHADGGVDHYR